MGPRDVLTGIRFGVLAVAMLAGACTSSTPLVTPPGASVEPTTRPSPTPVLLPSPATTASGVTPTSDRVIVRVEAWVDVGGWTQQGLFVYADGSIVDARSVIPVVRVLGSTGVQWIATQLRDSGLFTESRTIAFQPPPSGYAMYRVTFDSGERVVSVTAANAARDPESVALVTLAEGLMEPSRWVPTGQWGPTGPRPYVYVPSQARLTSEVGTLPAGAWSNAAQTVARVPWPSGLDPMTVGSLVPVPDQPNRRIRCAVVSGTDEQLIRAALSAMSPSDSDADVLESSWQLWTGTGGLLRVTLRPYLPHEVPACAPGQMPAAPSLASAPTPAFADMLLAAMGGVTPDQAAAGPSFWVAAMPQSAANAPKRVSYYADGSVVWQDAPAPAAGYGVRRLTVAGLAAVNTLIASTGLHDTSWSEAIPEGAPYDWMYSFVGANVIVNASDRGADPDASRLAAAIARLADPVAWLPASAWVDGPATVLPYRPASIRLWTRLEHAGPMAMLLPLALLDWPLDGTPEAWGEEDASMPGMGWRTGTVSVPEALELVRGLQAIGARPNTTSPDRAEYWLQAADPGQMFIIEMGIVTGEWGP